MSRGALFVPEDAPFSAEQRAWLNQLLAGLLSLPSQESASRNALKVSIFFASQGGTAERLAKKMAKRLKEDGHSTEVQSMEKITPDALAAVTHAIFFASTYGEGDPPDSACAFRDALFAGTVKRLDGLRFAVFCLGDRNYEHFCRFGVELDERLADLGASRLISRVESDVDVDTVFAAWSPQVSAAMLAPVTQQRVVVEESAASEQDTHVHNRDNPFHAQLVDRQVLTSASSTKQTVHIGFDLADAEIQYEAGDACGVLAQNDPDVVAEILALGGFSAEERVSLPGFEARSVEELLGHHLQITRLTRKTVQICALKAECHMLSSVLAAGGKELDAYLHGRGLIDLLHAYPGVFSDAGELMETLPRLALRLYSISSSPKAHGRELHCTIGVVRYNAHGRERGGVASTMLAHRMEVGSRVPIYLHQNKRFRLPVDASAPIIMIGPGTGIAPFRAFLHERRALGHTGRNWLFFGERSAKTDFLYCREMKSFVEERHLTRFDTAFSRDQEHKIYVQDRMLESGAEFFRWLQDGASVYVCGDASRMAKDVDAALHQIVERHGSLTTEAAQEYVSGLHEQRRYHRDVY